LDYLPTFFVGEVCIGLQVDWNGRGRRRCIERIWLNVEELELKFDPGHALN